MIDTLPNSLRTAFDNGYEQIGFGIGEKEYLFVAQYDERPFVTGLLFAAPDEADVWTPAAASGDEYADEDHPPETWKGLPDFMAEKIAWAARMHQSTVASEGEANK